MSKKATPQLMTFLITPEKGGRGDSYHVNQIKEIRFMETTGHTMLIDEKGEVRAILPPTSTIYRETRVDQLTVAKKDE